MMWNIGVEGKLLFPLLLRALVKSFPVGSQALLWCVSWPPLLTVPLRPAEVCPCKHLPAGTCAGLHWAQNSTRCWKIIQSFAVEAVQLPRNLGALSKQHLCMLFLSINLFLWHCGIYNVLKKLYMRLKGHPQGNTVEKNNFVLELLSPKQKTSYLLVK